MAYTTIKKPSDYFNTVLYTGNGSTQSITGVGFQPDWVWMKDRDSGTLHHVLVDAVRGTTKAIYSNLTASEENQSGSLTAFNSDGFSIGNMNDVNINGDNFVSWNWLGANGTASNTDGNTASTVSVNTTSGFSIVSYTGTGANATVGHGLGVAPKMIIIKNRIDAVNWEVGHDSIGWTKKLRLNTTDAETVDNGAFNDTAPTSSVFSLGNNGTSNGSGDNMIAYCFAEVKGFSKFGSYVGNLNDDGPFVYTGFKPAWVMVKDATTGEDWFMYDNRRPSYNYNHYLRANTNGTEVTTDNWVDFLSNGFKLRKGQTGTNSSGDTYIYMAFAEEPLVGDNPATAR